MHFFQAKTFGCRGIFGANLGPVNELSNLPTDIDLLSGYSQSKVVCEHLLHYAKHEKNFPLIIFRPGDMAGCSKTGALNEMDFVVRVLAGFMKLELAPNETTTFDSRLFFFFFRNWVFFFFTFLFCF